VRPILNPDQQAIIVVMLSFIQNEAKSDNGFDFIVVWKPTDGITKSVGRIFHISSGTNGPEWFWSLNIFEITGRRGPYSGRAFGFEEAKALWQRRWDSAEPAINR
jgi:hypothetical protein